MGMKQVWLGAGALSLLLALVTAPASAISGLDLHGEADYSHKAPRLSMQPLENLTSYVDPFVGTASGGNTFPGASAPFGMVQWSPDIDGWAPSGYYYGATQLSGFSLTHLSGAGCTAEGDIPIIPFSGEVSASPESSPSTYYMKFHTSSQSASPGYYGVKLDSGIGVQLTVTERTGYGLFSFPKGQPASFLVNTGGSMNGDSASNVRILGSNVIEGSSTSGQFCGASNSYTVYFAAEFHQGFSSFGTWTGQRLSPSSTSASGARAGAYVTFSSSGSPIALKVGLSYVSEENAMLNLQTEDPGWSFEAARDKVQGQWNAALNKIQVSGGTLQEKQTFYTALYHTFLSPNTFSDVNGDYIGFDNKVHNAGSQTQYANYSGWDIYRSEMPLLSFLMPRRASAMVESLVRDGVQGGRLPKWPVANGYTGTMDGDSADPIIATAYAMGARAFDTSSALHLMILGATVPGSLPDGYIERPGLQSYLKYGFVPDSENGTSETLEYSVDDASIGDFAREVGAPSGLVNTFLKRGQSWQNLFDPRSDLIEPKNLNGTFVTKFDPLTQSHYVEGTAYVYRWMVPQDYMGLAYAIGGDAKAASRLRQFFTQLNVPQGTPYAWMGNEPSILAPWMGDFIGHPALTQSVVRRIVNTLYQPTPNGLDGNDDLGTMSAWYVWSVLGLYPAVPGESGFAVGSPLFPQARVAWGGGRVMTIIGHGASSGAPYVRDLDVDAHGYPSTWLPMRDLTLHNYTTLAFGLSAVKGSYLRSSYATPESPYSDGFIIGRPPSLSVGLHTGIAFASPSTFQVSKGSNIEISFGIRVVGGMKGPIAWNMQVPVALQVQGPSGVIHNSSSTVTVHLQIPNSAPPGIYSVHVLFRPLTGSAISSPVLPATVDVAVDASNDLFAFYNNDGISSDSNVSSGNFDGGVRSYSSDLLAAAGIVPGSTITSAGVQYIWPYFSDGSYDNVTAKGQTIPITGTGTELGFIGAATNGNTQGQGTITYTDGTVQSFTLGLTDWTRLGGGGSIDYGNQIVAETAYRNDANQPDGRGKVNTYLYSTQVPLELGKTIASITLPVQQQNQGQLHIFVVGIKN